ncbi:two-component system response regulator [Chitinimonas sp.]|uniref:response regulator n=1 Tax=Chitinimonas sp. TaxID=1934313 RepID=UPI0035B2C235
MPDLPTVLVVDDDPLPRLLTTSALKGLYRIVEAMDGEAAVACALAEQPSLVLMDIRMPGIDGYEACRRLKAEPALADVPVVFVSAELNLADRLAAYDAGGEDFIGKPPSPDELRAKVAVTLKNVAERRRLADSVESAFRVAMTAMTSASELGGVISTLKRSFACNDLPALASAVLAGCAEYGLQACIRLQTPDATYGRSQAGPLTPVEAGVLEKLSEGDRIMSLGRQSAYHYGGLTLLIKNMPVHDAELTGRMRDNLALIAEGCESRLNALQATLALVAREQMHARLYRDAEAALQDIARRHAAHRSQTELVLDNLLNEIEVTFPSLGLTVRQEEVVSTLLRNTATRISALYDEGLDIAGHLAALQRESAAPQ